MLGESGVGVDVIKAGLASNEASAHVCPLELKRTFSRESCSVAMPLRQAGRRGRLIDALTARRAGLAGTARDDHAEIRRDDVETFADVLADLQPRAKRRRNKVAPQARSCAMLTPISADAPAGLVLVAVPESCLSKAKAMRAAA